MSQLKHNDKEYGVYIFDSFDWEAFLCEQFDSLADAKLYAEWAFNLAPNGADWVDIVDRKGIIVANYKTTGDKYPRLQTFEQFKAWMLEFETGVS